MLCSPRDKVGVAVQAQPHYPPYIRIKTKTLKKGAHDDGDDSKAVGEENRNSEMVV